MTHYDQLIDTIVMYLYDMRSEKEWDEIKAKRKAHQILITVEAFQHNRSLIQKENI